tara:strand:+ start:789 stop:1031 length:243 start_codon:yes stop_codon:yes gene_type:complete
VNEPLLPYNVLNPFDPMKKEFVCVKPRSSDAEDRFINMMDKLHSCRIDGRSGGRLKLSSISNRYSFEIFEGGDDHWEIIK